ncbi:hypothetical protein [Nostoc sp. DedQUE09]|nr:hypothetical protein [Nostoc sp. DedQUE09]MDZ7950534.1 hypothetical protein [Nostoc sp. DedQUE09]
MLSTLTIDERWGVILKFDDVDPDKFGQLVADTPNLSPSDSRFYVN